MTDRAAESKGVDAARRKLVEDGIAAHYPQLLARARSLTRNPALAEDLVQQTCLKALEHCDQYEPGHIDRWLMTILRNTFFAHLKRRGNNTVSLDKPGNRDSESTLLDFLQTPETGEAESRISLSQTFRFLACEPHTATLLDALGEGCEAAGVIHGIETGTVKSRISRLRTRLRKWVTGAPVSQGRPDPKILARLRLLVQPAETGPATPAIGPRTPAAPKPTENRILPATETPMTNLHKAFLLPPMPFETFQEQASWDTIKNLAGERQILPLKMPGNKGLVYVVPMALAQNWANTRNLRFTPVKLSEAKKAETLLRLLGDGKNPMVPAHLNPGLNIILLTEKLFEDLRSRPVVTPAPRGNPPPHAEKEAPAQPKERKAASSLSEQLEAFFKAAERKAPGSIGRPANPPDAAPAAKRPDDAAAPSATPMNGLPAAAQEDRAFRLMPPIGYSAYCTTRSDKWNRRFENLEIVPVTMKHSHHDRIGGYCVPMTPAVRDFAGDRAMRLSGFAARQLECLNDNDFPGSDRCHVLVFRDSPPYAFMSAALYERFKAERSPSIVSGEVSPAATAFEEAARDLRREDVARPEPAAAPDFEDWLDGLKQEGELGETTVLGKDVVVISRAALAALWRRAAAPGAAMESGLPQAVRKASNGSRKPNGHTPFAS